MPTELPIFQVDAFASALFEGNPAAIVPLDEWLPDALLQQIAAENNLAETAFLLRDDTGYQLRWFTPTVEVELCGHATLASGHIVFQFLAPGTRAVTFSTRHAGPLSVTETDGVLTLELPARPPLPVTAPEAVAQALGADPVETLANGMLVAVFDSAAAVRSLVPDFRKLAGIDFDGVIATAPGTDGIDFVSRYFAPQFGIDEDPVTGSAHCVLTPYWAKRLGRPRLEARQISARGGSLICEDRGERVTLSGSAQLYLTGKIHLP